MFVRRPTTWQTRCPECGCPTFGQRRGAAVTIRRLAASRSHIRPLDGSGPCMAPATASNNQKFSHNSITSSRSKRRSARRPAGLPRRPRGTCPTELAPATWLALRVPQADCRSPGTPWLPEGSPRCTTGSTSTSARRTERAGWGAAPDAVPAEPALEEGLEAAARPVRRATDAATPGSSAGRPVARARAGLAARRPGIILVSDPTSAGGAGARFMVMRQSDIACFRSPAFWMRLAGSFSRALLRMNSSPSGASGQSALRLGGVSKTIALTTCTRLRSLRENGCCPLASWKNTMPAEKTSDRRRHRSPRICSGAM